jgi:hypothetical protein
MKISQWMKAVAAFAVVSTGISQAQDSKPVSMPGETTPLVTEGIVGAPIDEVWKVFSTAEGYKKLGVAQAACSHSYCAAAKGVSVHGGI